MIEQLNTIRTLKKYSHSNSISIKSIVKPINISSVNIQTSSTSADVFKTNNIIFSSGINKLNRNNPYNLNITTKNKLDEIIIGSDRTSSASSIVLVDKTINESEELNDADVNRNNSNDLYYKPMFDIQHTKKITTITRPTMSTFYSVIDNDIRTHDIQDINTILEVNGKRKSTVDMNMDRSIDSIRRSSNTSISIYGGIKINEDAKTIIEKYINVNTKLNEGLCGLSGALSKELGASSLYKPNIIPNVCYSCWHSSILPTKMRENYDNLIKQNPEMIFSLYDENMCRQFIYDNFDETVLHAYDTLCPSSYKSDLWRYCVLYKNGGIYLDIKYISVNNFKLLQLCTKEHFTLERIGHWGDKMHGIYTALIAVKPENEILNKCISKIVQNVQNRDYGRNALYPTGPGLLGNIILGDELENFKNMYNIELFANKLDMNIIYQNNIIFKIYPEYREEQLIHQTNLYYRQMWLQMCIYNIRSNIAISYPSSPPPSSPPPSPTEEVLVNIPSILCIFHIGNYDVFLKMKKYVDILMNNQSNKYTVDLFINIVDHNNSWKLEQGDLPIYDYINQLKTEYPIANILVSENYGFDIGSFFNILDIVQKNNKEYDYVLKIHTKTNDNMRNKLLEPILSSPTRIYEILDYLKNNNDIGCIGSKKCYCMDSIMDEKCNESHLKMLQNIYFDRTYSKLPFITGTMFWMRFSILRNVFMKHNLSNIYNSMNTEKSFDWNWYLWANKDYINTPLFAKNLTREQSYDHYINIGKPGGLSKNLYDAIKQKHRSALCRDGMIEHSYERLFSYAVNHLGMKTMYI